MVRGMMNSDLFTVPITVDTIYFTAVRVERRSCMLKDKALQLKVGVLQYYE
jgi:hypothetical protein